jgi:UDP-N-acetylmuramoyl-tripeptide--D-alanyl-D-alanine ligase
VCTRDAPSPIAGAAEEAASVATAIPPNRAVFDATRAAQATGGTVTRQSPSSRPARGWTTDSRAVVAGSGFVALKGDRFDGHDYVEKAVDAGAAIVVVGRGRSPTGARADAVEVDDTLAAWGALARAHLRGWRAERPDASVVAITGSAGKTTTKEIAASLLRVEAEVHATAGNLNNRVGVPAVVLGLEPRHRVAVLEVGMSLPGEIAALGAVVEPDVAVVTNVGLAHAGGVGGSIDDVAGEKGALFASLGPRGVAVANADDERVMAEARARHRGSSVTFGRAQDADVRLVRRVALGGQGSRVHLRRRGEESAFVLPMPGEAAAIDFVAAVAAAEAALGRPLADRSIAAALRHLVPAPGRLKPCRLSGNVFVLDDAYNANPASVRAAFDALKELQAVRRVAVLGEMKELGSAAEAEHEKLGDAVADAGVALLVSCGGLADVTAHAAERLGVDVVLTADASQAADVAVARVRAGDVVLVKASRSVGAERVVERLIAARGLEPAEPTKESA